jgi:indolepyruvate ferredoxin oxidoreductase beta subunit
MCFEDVIRVADLKSRAGRYQRVRAEAQAPETDIVRVTEYMKPGIDEIAAILPQRLGAWLMRRAVPGSWIRRAQVGIHVRSSSVWGHLLLRALARLRPLRRSSLRFNEEREAMSAWLQAMQQALAASPRFALQLASLPQVLKGYGDTQLRGRHNYARLWAAHVAAAFIDGADLDAAAGQLEAAFKATLSDPEGRLNAAAAVPQAGSAAPQTIRWIEMPRKGDRAPGTKGEGGIRELSRAGTVADLPSSAMPDEALVQSRRDGA